MASASQSVVVRPVSGILGRGGGRRVGLPERTRRGNEWAVGSEEGAVVRLRGKVFPERTRHPSGSEGSFSQTNPRVLGWAV